MVHATMISSMNDAIRCANDVLHLISLAKVTKGHSCTSFIVAHKLIIGWHKRGLTQETLAEAVFFSSAFSFKSF